MRVTSIVVALLGGALALHECEPETGADEVSLLQRLHHVAVSTLDSTESPSTFDDSLMSDTDIKGLCCHDCGDDTECLRAQLDAECDITHADCMHIVSDADVKAYLCCFDCENDAECLRAQLDADCGATQVDCSTQEPPSGIDDFDADIKDLCCYDCENDAACLRVQLDAGCDATEVACEFAEPVGDNVTIQSVNVLQTNREWDCWDGCGQKSGWCDRCGHLGVCCRAGQEKWNVKECRGVQASSNKHTCRTRVPPPIPAANLNTMHMGQLGIHHRELHQSCLGIVSAGWCEKYYLTWKRNEYHPPWNRFYSTGYASGCFIQRKRSIFDPDLVMFNDAPPHVVSIRPSWYPTFKVCRWQFPALLAAAGAEECPHGWTVSESYCLQYAHAAVPEGTNIGRKHLVVGNWGWVPPGCSVQSAGDWAAHFNKKTLRQGAWNDGVYTPVCKSRNLPPEPTR